MKDFTSGHIGRQILLFAIPIILGNLMMQFYQMVDSAIVGQFIGTDALAAVGASGPVVFTIIAMVMGIGGGASTVISQYFGRGDMEKVRITSDTLHIVLLVCGAIIGLVGYFYSDDILRLNGLPEELIPLGHDYLSVYLGGVFVLFGFNTIVAMMRGVGDSRTPLYFLAISSVLNIGLDLLFIVVFGWGVASVAWATVIAQGTAYFLAIYYINRRDDIVFHINLFNLRFNRTILKQCLRYGLPTGLQQSFIALGAMALFGIINTYGTDTIAGISAAFRIDAIAVLPALNFALALTSFVGQNIGKGKIERAKKGMRITLLYSTIFCVVQSTIIIVFGHDILRLFTTNIEVIETGNRYLFVVSLFYLIFAVMQVFIGFLRGSGAVMLPMVSVFISMWLARIPIAIVGKNFTDLSGADVISGSVVIGWAVGAIIVIWFYFSGKWKGKSIFDRK